jgi:hypothetical protein
MATRRAAVRNSLRSWLNPELAADPLPLLLAGGEAAASVGGLADPFPPARAVLFSGGEGLIVGCGAAAAGIASEGDPAAPLSAAEEPVTDAGSNSAVTSGACSRSSSTTSKTLLPDPSSLRVSANSRAFSVSIGWQPDGDLGGYGQPLDDTAVLVVRDANDHDDSSFAASIPCPFSHRGSV